MRLAVMVAAIVLVAASCSDTATTTSRTTRAGTPPTTSAPPPATTAGPSTSVPPTATTIAPIDGVSLADVAADAQADIDFRFSLGGQQAPGPLVVQCPAESVAVPATYGDVFACPATDGADTVGVVMVVVSEFGETRWLAGPELPSNADELTAAYGRVSNELFCRELAEEGGPLFSLGYTGAMAYWFLDGMPERMDADLDGAPCETVFSYPELTEFWRELIQFYDIDAPSEDRLFVFVVEVSADGSTLTVDPAEWFFGDEATAAARNDGLIGPDEFVENDYYIRNLSADTEDLPLAPDAAVDLVGFSPDSGQLGYLRVGGQDLADILIEVAECEADDFPPECQSLGFGDWVWYGGGFLPYWLVVEDGVVVALEEVFLP